MDQLKLLSDFFSAIDKDPRISITHIGLYAALFQYWSKHDFETPFHVFSHDIMPIAKILSSITYHRRLKDLNDFGYLKYLPSYKRNQGSKIYLLI